MKQLDDPGAHGRNRANKANGGKANLNGGKNVEKGSGHGKGRQAKAIGGVETVR